MPYARPSPDGRYLAVWQQEHGLDILSVTTGRKIKKYTLQPLWVSTLHGPPMESGLHIIGKVDRDVYEIFLISVLNGSVRQL